MLRLSRLILASILIFGLSSCELLRKEQADEEVARAFDKHLHRSDLINAIPEGSSKEDSIVIARRYIGTWVRKQLMLDRAELALSDEQKDFDKKIEEYRSSLLIYSYRQKLLVQKMDTVITDDEIVEYYDNNISNFILSQDIVKSIFVKVPLTAPNIGSVRNWSRSGTMDAMDQLEKYCINYADKFDTFNDTWIYFSTIQEKIPLAITQPSRFLRYNKNIETSDSLFHYFVHVREHLTVGEITPMELIREDIKNILLNKRKIEFYQNLESQVYNEGVNRNQFEIY
jgi:hypothetical protein